MCSGGLGHSMPAAVGIAMAKPEKKVIAVIGDGSAMYAIQALWSAANLRLPITFVILKNRRYAALQISPGSLATAKVKRSKARSCPISTLSPWPGPWLRRRACARCRATGTGAQRRHCSPSPHPRRSRSGLTHSSAFHKNIQGDKSSLTSLASTACAVLAWQLFPRCWQAALHCPPRQPTNGPTAPSA